MKKGFRQIWEEWYGDMVCDYQWHEIEYKDRKVLYVCGRATVGDEDRRLNSGFTQVMGYLEPEELLSEEEQEEVKKLLKGSFAVENVSFWSVVTP